MGGNIHLKVIKGVPNYIFPSRWNDVQIHTLLLLCSVAKLCFIYYLSYYYLEFYFHDMINKQYNTDNDKQKRHHAALKHQDKVNVQDHSQGVGLSEIGMDFRRSC